MNITVEIKNVYGNRTVYPACSASLLLARLAGKKTFTLDALNTIKALGYTVEVKQQTI